MRRLLPLLLVMLCACKTVDPTLDSKPMAEIHYWGMPGTGSMSLTFFNEDTVIIRKSHNTKDRKYYVKLPAGSSESIKPLLQQALDEFKRTPTNEKNADGTSISIALQENIPSEATLRHYGEYIYDLKSYPILVKKLDELLPSKYWTKTVDRSCQANIYFWGLNGIKAIYLDFSCDNTVTIRTFNNDKETTHSLKMTSEARGSLNKLLIETHSEIKNLHKKQNLTDGFSIQIVLQGNYRNHALLSHYNEENYQLKSFPLLYNALHDLIPTEYWK